MLQTPTVTNYIEKEVVVFTKESLTNFKTNLKNMNEALHLFEGGTLLYDEENFPLGEFGPECGIEDIRGIMGKLMETKVQDGDLWAIVRFFKTRYHRIEQSQDVSYHPVFLGIQDGNRVSFQKLVRINVKGLPKAEEL